MELRGPHSENSGAHAYLWTLWLLQGQSHCFRAMLEAQPQHSSSAIRAWEILKNPPPPPVKDSHRLALDHVRLADI